MVRDAKTEAWLTRMGIDWRYEKSIQLASINRIASTNNQGRLYTRLDSNIVQLYAESMKDGAQFPAISLAQTPNKGLVVISGNHRIAAAESIGRTSFDAYVSDIADAALLELATRASNAIEGFAPGTDERMEQAKYYVRTYGAKASEIGPKFGIRTDKLAFALKVDETREKLAAAKVEVERLSAEHIAAIYPLRNVNVMKRVADVVIAHGLTSDEARGIAHEAMADTEREAIARVSKAEMRYEHLNAGVKGKARPRKPNNIYRALGLIEHSVIGNGGLVSMGLTSDQQLQDLEKRAADVFQTLRSKIDEARKQISAVA